MPAWVYITFSVMMGETMLAMYIRLSSSRTVNNHNPFGKKGYRISRFAL
jgi:hypothetical protein